MEVHGMNIAQAVLPIAQRGWEQSLSSRGRLGGGDVPPSRCCLDEADRRRHSPRDGRSTRRRITPSVTWATSESKANAAPQAGQHPCSASTASSTTPSLPTGLPGRFERFLIRRLAPTSRRPLPRPIARCVSFGGVNG